jgi:stage II sporulation protein D
MISRIISIYFLLYFLPVSSEAQIKIKLFSGQPVRSAIFTVTAGKYEINTYVNDSSLFAETGEPVIISNFNNKIAVKVYNARGFLCDSVSIRAFNGECSFSIRNPGKNSVLHYYSGSLSCYTDPGNLVIINNCDIEQYIAGVVRAEGGSGRNMEYFNTQAIIVRTYMYKYFDKHISDGYNLCDSTHCQVFNGISTDSSIVFAAKATHNLVIIDRDSVLIISAFHSNCGGETSNSDDVWLINQPYLQRVSDPYCLLSRNAIWRKSFSTVAWADYLRRYGYAGSSVDPATFNYIQKSRSYNYRSGSFTLPLRTLRSDLNLRSSFFSVTAKGDSVILNGRGYGHGVGLCQEGAMVMAEKGFDYKQIIDFYFRGVMISDVENAKKTDIK